MNVANEGRTIQSCPSSRQTRHIYNVDMISNSNLARYGNRLASRTAGSWMSMCKSKPNLHPCMIMQGPRNHRVMDDKSSKQPCLSAISQQKDRIGVGPTKSQSRDDFVIPERLNPCCMESMYIKEFLSWDNVLPGKLPSVAFARVSSRQVYDGRRRA